MLKNLLETWSILAPEECNIDSKQDSFLRYDKDTTKALLRAYLSALAAQRSIEPGDWMHFKGARMDVIGLGRSCDGWASLYLREKFDFVGDFITEESSALEIMLFRDKDGNLIFAGDNLGEDRVFYHHGSRAFSRKADVFLGLVGMEHPEHEGKLRFRNVPKN